MYLMAFINETASDENIIVKDEQEYVWSRGYHTVGRPPRGAPPRNVFYKIDEGYDIIIIIIMSVVPSGTQVVYKSFPVFSVPVYKPEITPAVLPTFVQYEGYDIIIIIIIIMSVVQLGT
jgi:hypothetical protein